MVHALSSVSSSERNQLRALTDELARAPSEARIAAQDAAPDWLVEGLREVLGLERTLIYRPARSETGSWELGGLVTDRRSGPFFRRYAQALNEVPSPFHFNPLRPEPRQRNRITVRADVCKCRDHDVERACVVQRVWPRVGLTAYDQLRVLLCDGDALLGFVGGIRGDPVTPREKALLGALVDPMRRYLSLERRLRSEQGARAGLDAALAALAGPAFIATRSGAVLHANATAKGLLESGRFRREHLVEIVARPGERARVSPLDRHGMPHAYLVVLWASDPSAEHALNELCADWAVTPRERAVLRRLVQGDSNKEIAALLGVAEVSVERHVTSLLRKSQRDSRTRLVAGYWQTVMRQR